MSSLFTDYENEELSAAILSVLQEFSAGSFQLPTSEAQAESHQRGFIVVVGVVGPYKGRVVLQAAEEAVGQVAQSMNRGQTVTDVKEQCLFLAKLTNMFAGKVVTLLNYTRLSLGQRLTPPAVLTGIDLALETSNQRSQDFCFAMGKVVLELRVSMEGL